MRPAVCVYLVPPRRVKAAALVVDGGIYRHDFVAGAVVDGLMRVGLDTGIPVLSMSLTPHQFQETPHHIAIYRDHFVTKGREAAEAALMIARTREQMAARPAQAGFLDLLGLPAYSVSGQRRDIEYRQCPRAPQARQGIGD